jgi:hypothetical protein
MLCKTQFPDAAFVLWYQTPSMGLSLRLEDWVSGAQLLRFDIRKPGIVCVPRAIHSLPEGDAFVALGPLQQDSLAAQAQLGQQLLAASTLDCVMLMDLCRPGQALLKWPHGVLWHPSGCRVSLSRPQKHCSFYHCWKCWHA